MKYNGIDETGLVHRGVNMSEFKAVINDPNDGKTYQKSISGHHANSLIGRKIGDEFDGIFVGLPGYKLEITGGSDNSGIPMKSNLPGKYRKKILLSKSVGFHPKKKGQRRRKNVRGRVISEEIVQINMKITAHGTKDLSTLKNVD